MGDEASQIHGDIILAAGMFGATSAQQMQDEGHPMCKIMYRRGEFVQEGLTTQEMFDRPRKCA